MTPIIRKDQRWRFHATGQVSTVADIYQPNMRGMYGTVQLIDNAGTITIIDATVLRRDWELLDREGGEL